MFLWVHLILTMLEDVHTLKELQDAIDILPEGLDEA